MDDQPKTRKERKGSKTKDLFNKRTIRIKEANQERAATRKR